MQQLPLFVVDGPDSQLIEFVGTVLPSPDPVLDCVVPVEVLVGSAFGDFVGVGFGLFGHNASTGQERVLDEVRSGLSG